MLPGLTLLEARDAGSVLAAAEGLSFRRVYRAGDRWIAVLPGPACAWLGLCFVGLFVALAWEEGR